MKTNSPADIVELYSQVAKKKANRDIGRLIVLSVMAGASIAFAAVISNTAVHQLANVGMIKLVSGLIFPFGLIIIMLMGSELFTGNIMISISVAKKETTVPKMLRNWSVVYLGNFAGALLVALGIVFIGQLNYSDGQLALYTMELAVSKASLPFWPALVSGIFCNLLVCSAVLLFFSSTNTSAQILACYMPTAFFVFAGFEHSIANMYYLSAGVLARSSGLYTALAAEAGLNVSTLTWSYVLSHNLLPVTLGNIIGGIVIAFCMHYTQSSKALQKTVSESIVTP